MKKLILEALTTKFEGVSTKILEGIAEKLSKTVTTEAEVTAAVEGVTFQSVLESYGDQRATSASVTAVANYEKKHNLKDGKVIETDPPTPPTPPAPPAPSVPPTDKPKTEEVPSYIKEILASNKSLSETVKSLQNEINVMKAGKLSETRRSEVNKLISKLSPAQQNPYKRIKVEALSDDEYAAFIDEVKGDVAAIEKESLSFGKPYVGGAQVSGKATDAEIAEVVNKIM